MKKKRTSKFTAPKSDSPVIEKIRALLLDSKNLAWANSLPPEEVTFLYELDATSQANRNFIPTEKQSKWALDILKRVSSAQEIKVKQ